MQIYYAICAGLVTVSLTTAMVFLIVTTLELQKTSQAVRRLALNVDDKVEKLKGIADIVEHLSKAVTSNWMRGAEFAYGIFSGLRERQARRQEREEPEQQEQREGV